MATKNKPKNKDSVFVTLSIRFRRDHHEKITRIARENSRTIAGQIAELIKAYPEEK